MDTHAPTAAALVQPPAAGADVCRICRDWKADTDPYCDNCHRNARLLGSGPVPVHAFTLYHRTSPIRDTLIGYKDPACPQLQAHEREIGRLLHLLMAKLGTKGRSADGICVVPSSSNDRLHPLHHIAAQTLPQHRLIRPLRRGPATTTHRQPNPDGYTGLVRLDGQRILLIDDVYTTGARSQSAAHTLTRAGAAVEQIAVIARRINPDATPELADWSHRHHLTT